MGISCRRVVGGSGSVFELRFDASRRRSGSFVEVGVESALIDRSGKLADREARTRPKDAEIVSPANLHSFAADADRALVGAQFRANVAHNYDTGRSCRARQKGRAR